MKITIINPSPDEEEEIIIKCRVLTEDINHLICKLKNGDRKITGYDAKGITLLALPDIFYFEATDNKVFAYGQKNVYEVKEKLYQLEKLQRQESSNQTFLIKESTNLESTVVPRAAVLFLILIVKKKM